MIEALHVLLHASSSPYCAGGVRRIGPWSAVQNCVRDDGLASGHVLAAVDRQGRAGDEAGVVAGEEDDARGRSPRPRRGGRPGSAAGSSVFSTSSGTACTISVRDIARRDHVDGDALGGVLLRQRLGEADHAGLGGGVVRLAHLALLAVDRGDDDDAPEAARRACRRSPAGSGEHGVEVGADHRLPLLEGHAVEHAVAGDAGIVDQDVDRAELGLDRLDAGLAGGGVGDVELVDRDAGLGLELVAPPRRCRRSSRRPCSRPPSGRFEIAAPMPRVPPVTNATRAMSVSFPDCSQRVSSDPSAMRRLGVGPPRS